jgi:hypothetical protein
MVADTIRGIDLGRGEIRTVTTIDLSGDMPVTVIVLAYRADFDRVDPAGRTGFTLQPPSGLFACILYQAQNLSAQAAQAAVWMNTASIGWERMNSKFPIGPGDWTAAKGVADKCRSSAR